MSKETDNRTPLEILEQTAEASVGISAAEIRKMSPDKHRKRAEQKHGEPTRVSTDLIVPVIDSKQVEDELDEVLREPGSC